MIEVEKETGPRGVKSEKRENGYGEEREKKEKIEYTVVEWMAYYSGNVK